MYDRIKFTIEQHGGMPIIKDKEVQVEHIIDLLAEGNGFEKIKKTYPGLDDIDCKQALTYSLEQAVDICENELAEVLEPINK